MCTNLSNFSRARSPDGQTLPPLHNHVMLTGEHDREFPTGGARGGGGGGEDSGGVISQIKSLPYKKCLSFLTSNIYPTAHNVSMNMLELTHKTRKLLILKAYSSSCTS
jgi:hypothetical protein